MRHSKGTRGIWKQIESDGISFEDRLIEPLLVHIKEYMPDSDLEDITDEIKELVNKMFIRINKDPK